MGEPRYVAFPSLQRRVVSRQRVEITNPVLGGGITASAEIEKTLRRFRTPTSPRGIVSLDDLAALVEAGLLVEASKLPMLARGLLCPVTAVGEPGWTLTQQAEHLTSRSVALFGVPSDTAGQAGARSGPSEVRRTLKEWFGVSTTSARRSSRDRGAVKLYDFDLRRVYAEEPELMDMGDIYTADGQFELICDRVSEVTRRTSTRGARVVMLGGDHSLTWPALRGMVDTYPELGVIHFDAHHDMYYPDLELNHANPFEHFLNGTKGGPLLQLGLRGFQRIRNVVSDSRRRYFSARELRRMSPEDAFADLPTNIPYYISIDIDCLSPQVAPETGTPSVGGLDIYMLEDLLLAALARFDVVGSDVMEVGRRSRSDYHFAAEAAARLATHVIMSGCAWEQLGNARPKHGERPIGIETVR